MVKPLLEGLNEIKSQEWYDDSVNIILLQEDSVCGGSRIAFLGKVNGLLVEENKEHLQKLSYIGDNAFTIGKEKVIMVNIGFL